MRPSIFIIFGVFAMVCCSSTLHKSHGYKKQENDLGWCTLHAKLRGKSTEVNDGMSYTGSPYELLIWFETEDKDIEGCELIIDHLSLSEINNGRLVLSEGESKTLFEKRSDGAFISSFCFKDIKMKYVEHSLRFSYRCSIGCSSTNTINSIELVFHKDYEERKLSFWDSLMGI